MKKYMGFLIMVGAMTGSALQAEVVITSPTGVQDESDVVLEKAVESVKNIPADTVAVVGDTVVFIGTEMGNTAHGVVSAFKAKTPRETVRTEMIRQVDETWDVSDDVQMRSYEVSAKMAKEMVQDAGSDAAVLDVRNFFMGIQFSKGTSAFYRPDFNRLVVHQTSANLQAIDQLMGRFSEEPTYKQIEIETKFVEVEQKTLNELGFDWTFTEDWNLTKDLAMSTIDPLTGQQTLTRALRTATEALSGAGSGATVTLTKNGWLPIELAITALEQSDGADVLSAPSVTTTDGSTAEIWVGDREIMPTKFSPNSDNTSINVAYDGFKEMNIGVHLEVTPVVAENNLINLELKPEVIDLVGYDSYAITPADASMIIWSGADTTEMSTVGRYPIPSVPGMDTAWNIMRATLGGTDPNDLSQTVNYEDFDGSAVIESTPAEGYFDTRRRIEHGEYGIVVPQLIGSLPVFRVRKIETNLTVADGSTVGMGGLIYDKLETYKDKVPVLGSIPLLGRLFRSEGERSVKRNLMIFVTATQVDVNGRRSADLATR